MKTQTIFRNILAVIAILFSCNNVNGNAQTTAHYSINTILKTREAVMDYTVSAAAPSASENTACIICRSLQHEYALPAIPEPNGDHEFHSFHIKHKEERRISFLKNIANKMMNLIYYLVALIRYSSFKH